MGAFHTHSIISHVVCTAKPEISTTHKYKWTEFRWPLNSALLEIISILLLIQITLMYNWHTGVGITVFLKFCVRNCLALFWCVKDKIDPLWEDKCLHLLKGNALMQQENLTHAKAQQSTDILYSLGEKLGEFRGNLNCWHHLLLCLVVALMICKEKNIVDMLGSSFHAAEV